MKKLTTEEFINRCIEVHDNLYDYSKCAYINARTKVIIICSEHGDFSQNASSHMNGAGCPSCANQYVPSTEEWIIRASKIHNKHYNKYIYDKVNYRGSHSKIIITCPEHGDFMQMPYQHLTSHGCPVCSVQKQGERKRRTKKEFVKAAKCFHHNFYTYNSMKYIDYNTKVEITCPLHGSFWQVPNVHVRHGCKECGNMKSNSPDARSKCTATIRKKITEAYNRVDFTEYQNDKKLYKKMCWYYTGMNNLNKLDDIEKRGLVQNGGWHLDHKYSIQEGFTQGVQPYIIGSIHNLVMMPGLENISKGATSSISKDELFTMNNTNVNLSHIKIDKCVSSIYELKSKCKLLLDVNGNVSSSKIRYISDRFKMDIFKWTEYLNIYEQNIGKSIRCILEDIVEIPICNNTKCQKLVKYNTSGNIFNEYCSNKCVNA